jgi:5-methylcytosine-specific restriction endonuclease McrA
MDIEDFKTSKGGYTKATLAQFGVSWPPPKGWKKRLKKQLSKKTKQPTPEKKVVKTKVSKNPFYNSWEWKKLRYEAFLKHGRVCLCCGARPPEAVLHVDHIKPLKKYPELALDINNLQILCRSCNMGKSNIDETDWRQEEEIEAEWFWRFNL